MAGPCSPRPHCHRPILPLAIILLLISPFSLAATDAETLLNFRSTLSGAGGKSLSNWVTNTPPCKGDAPLWNGLICKKGVVIGLQLEGMNLSGKLSLDTLVALPGLRSLSFSNNAFEGDMPDLRKLSVLKSVFLSTNSFSGTIPDDAFVGMRSLKKLHLSRNQFGGPLPKSLAALSRLLELMIDGNAFTGPFPDLRQTNLKVVNVSNNNLEGPIPGILSKMPADLFAGNKALCGPPLSAVCTDSTPSKKPSVPLVATIIAIAVGILLSVVGAMLAVARRRREEQLRLGGLPSSKNPKKATSFREENRHVARAPSARKKAVEVEQGSPDDSSVRSGGSARKPVNKVHDQGKLVFVNALKGDREKFELQDLLKASAEILPGGSLGSCYKAILQNGPSVVVKRFKEMNAVGREEFQEHMSRLGRLSHPNLLPLIAYYYRREEKLLVTEYSTNGSLANLLQGNRGVLDWPTRLKIVKGIGRGLVYLYESLRMLGLPHGHLKSSNVVLDESYEPLLTDYGLAPVMNQAHASQMMVAYKAPEIRQYGRTTKKSDVWCFGMLILEILTGKQGSKTGGMDLATWVNSVVREEWTGEVFDAEMKRNQNAEGEMLKLLRIGLGCCEKDVEKRWEMNEVLDKIEELKERDDQEDCSSEGYSSSKAMSQGDDFSFPNK